MSPRVHFDAAPHVPRSPPPAYAAHNFDGMTSFAQKERMASIAETKLTYLVSQKRREPSLRQVLLHAGFLEKVLDSIDSTTPEEIAAEPMIEEEPQVVSEIPAPAYELHQSLSSITEVDEDMEVDEEEQDEDMPPLERTVSHRPGSPVSSDDDDSDEEELVSPPPKYISPAPDHPLFSLLEVREKARREELSNQYHIGNESHQNMFLLNTALAVAA
jgi:hypothetical protein